MGLTINPNSGDIGLSTGAGGGTGDVVGPASATDNAVARFNSTTGKLVQNSNAVVDDNANLTLSVPTGVQVTKGGLNLTHTNGTGTSQYRISQDDYDLLQIKRTGDTTGDGAVWSLIDLQSPTVASDTEDSESTMSLTTRSSTPTSVARSLDIYNDEYSRDNGMGLRQLYKNTTPNPIRFESHDKTTSNGAWTMTGVSVTSGSPNGSYTSTSGITPAAEDWIWDNAGTYFADDTKILSINTGAKTFVLNRNATGTNASVAARGKNIRESLRITPDRQLLVRKHIADSGSTVAEFGGDVAIDGDITSGGVAVPTISSTDTLTNKTLTAPKFADTGFIADADGNEQLQFNASASAVNHIAIQNGATGLAPSIAAVGDDTDITLYVKGKGTGSIVIADGNSAQIIEGTGVASAVNYTVVSNAATGDAVSLSAAGTDTNIDVDIVPKGTGKLTVGGEPVETTGAWQTWIPTHTGFSADPSGGIYKYRYVGDEIEIEIVEPNDGTSNASTFTMTLPVTAATITDMEWVGFANSRNNSSYINNTSLGVIASAGTIITFWISPNRSTAWGTTNGKRCAYLRMKYRWQ